MLKKTPLSSVHEKLRAAMVEFGGWYMPVQYTNVIDEHLATRQRVGLFDICHMGEFEIKGENSLSFLQKILTNDVSRLEEDKAMYTVMCYEDGGCVDDLFVYKLKDKYMLVVNAENIGKDFEWLNKNKIGGVEIKNISDETAKLDIQGPDSENALQKLTDANLSEIKRFHCKEILLNNVSMLISRTGYTGEDGFEIYFSSEKAVEMWDKILEAGREFGIKPIGLGARDTLRLEAGYSLYGHEINEKLNPIEAGIGFVVKLNKDFIGKEFLQKQAEEGTQKKLFCFEMIDRCVPRENYKIFDMSEITTSKLRASSRSEGGISECRKSSIQENQDFQYPSGISEHAQKCLTFLTHAQKHAPSFSSGSVFYKEEIGFVTSGTFSPTFKKGIGMGYVKTGLKKIGDGIMVKIRDKLYRAKIVERPFYKYAGNK